MSELVCVTSGCREGGVGIETRGARRIAFCAIWYCWQGGAPWMCQWMAHKSFNSKNC